MWTNKFSIIAQVRFWSLETGDAIRLLEAFELNQISLDMLEG